MGNRRVTAAAETVEIVKGVYLTIRDGAQQYPFFFHLSPLLYTCLLGREHNFDIKKLLKKLQSQGGE